MSESCSTLENCRAANLETYKNSICDLKALESLYKNCEEPYRKQTLQENYMQCFTLHHEIDIAYAEQRAAEKYDSTRDSWMKFREERRAAREA
mmetsp:Transcript_836/g.1902  ORF Transcript_836/g.1902 Transcript_836/m.1902 type:complete len:93 (-) Transcript_836:1578-1856(-)